MGIILSVLDNKENFEFIRSICNEYIPGSQLLGIKPGEEIVNSVLKEKPDVIMIDEIIQGSDGIMLCEKLKENSKSRNIPIILLISAGSSSNRREKAFNAGADALISEPIERIELASLLRMMVRIKATDDNLRQRTNQTGLTELSSAIDERGGSESKFRELFEKSGDAILIIENRKFVDCNQATVHMLGYKTKHEFLNSHPSKLSPKYQPDGRESVEKANEMMSLAKEKGTHRFEWDHTRSNGEVFPVEVVLTAIEDLPGKEVLHTVWRDITERKAAMSELFEHREHLEELVKERTLELENKNKELLRFHDLFVGREFRIKELRDKVKELEKRK